MSEHPYEQFEEFVLGDLDQDSAARVFEHADRCPSCAVLLADALNAAASLSQAAGERVASAALHARITAAVTGPKVWERRRSRVLFGMTGAMAAAVMAMLLWNADLLSSTPSFPLSTIVHSHFTHHPLQGNLGSAKVLYAPDGKWVYVVADALAPHRRFDFWENRNGSFVRLGEFKSDRLGRATGYWEQDSGRLGQFAIVPAGADPLHNRDALRWP